MGIHVYLCNWGVMCDVLESIFTATETTSATKKTHLTRTFISGKLPPIILATFHSRPSKCLLTFWTLDLDYWFCLHILLDIYRPNNMAIRLLKVGKSIIFFKSRCGASKDPQYLLVIGIRSRLFNATCLAIILEIERLFWHYGIMVMD